jgi:HlyD family secretion protein
VNLKLARKPTLIAVGVGIALLLGWLVTSQGPLAPAKVTLAKVEQGPLIASTFGISTVEARRSYALGPTVASRVARVLVDPDVPLTFPP